MPRTKIVNGVRMNLTPAEELERDAEEAQDVLEKPNKVRASRNEILVADVDPIVSNSLRWNDMTDAKRTEWTNYRQALLDIPEQSGFPNDITWPTKPE